MIDSPRRYDKVDATTDPNSSNDFSQGFEVGSKWFNTVTKQWFTCNNNTPSLASWSPDLFAGPTLRDFPKQETFYSTLNGSNIVVSNTASGGAPAPTAQQAEPRHPGIRRLRTGTTLALAGTCIDQASIGVGGHVLSDGITDIMWVAKTIAAVPNLVDSFRCMYGFNASASFAPTFGIRWDYDYAGYGGDGFWRIRAFRGALSINKVTPITWSSASSDWRYFGIRVFGDSSLAPNRYIEFWYGDEIGAGTPYQLISTITEAEALLIGLSIPWETADVCTMCYGILKPSGTAVERRVWSDYISINKIII